MYGEFVYCDKHSGDHYRQDDCVWLDPLPAGALGSLLESERKMTARCGKFEKHEPHVFGKELDKFCSGQIAYR